MLELRELILRVAMFHEEWWIRFPGRIGRFWTVFITCILIPTLVPIVRSWVMNCSLITLGPVSLNTVSRSSFWSLVTTRRSETIWGTLATAWLTNAIELYMLLSTWIHLCFVSLSWSFCGVVTLIRWLFRLFGWLLSSLLPQQSWVDSMLLGICRWWSCLIVMFHMRRNHSIDNSRILLFQHIDWLNIIIRRIVWHMMNKDKLIRKRMRFRFSFRIRWSFRFGVMYGFRFVNVWMKYRNWRLDWMDERWNL